MKHRFIGIQTREYRSCCAIPQLYEWVQFGFLFSVKAAMPTGGKSIVSTKDRECGLQSVLAFLFVIGSEQSKEQSSFEPYAFSQWQLICYRAVTQYTSKSSEKPYSTHRH